MIAIGKMMARGFEKLISKFRKQSEQAIADRVKTDEQQPVIDNMFRAKATARTAQILSYYSPEKVGGAFGRHLSKYAFPEKYDEEARMYNNRNGVTQFQAY